MLYLILYNICYIEKQGTSGVFETSFESGYGKRLARKSTTTNIKIRNICRICLCYIFIKIFIISQ